MTPLQRLQVFMLYPNAGIFFRKAKFNIKSYQMWGCVLDLYNEEFKSYTTDAGSCQLILRGIDQLTEEEKRELAKVLYPDYSKVNIFIKDFGLHIEIDHYNGDNTEQLFTIHYWEDLPYPAADYLRSKNIALPYMGIDLFEEGIAVREKD